MEHLEQEIAAYERLRPALEAEHRMQWVVFRGTEHVGTYPSFQEAAEDAIQKFGRGPYLIRQVGAPPIRLPSSARYRPIHSVR